MYVVLMALLALNVSPEVLYGFDFMNDGLNYTVQRTRKGNSYIYRELDSLGKENPIKAGHYYNTAMTIRTATSQLVSLIDSVKTEIAVATDGKNADPNHIKNKEENEGVNRVFLSKGRGKQLQKAINQYKNIVADAASSMRIKEQLMKSINGEWKENDFENLPAAAAMAYLTKLKVDVAIAEREILQHLMENIDFMDNRVNSMKTILVPNSTTIIKGGKLNVDVVMAAVDTTKQPDIFIGGNKLEGNHISRVCNTVGDFTLNGWMDIIGHNGKVTRNNFSLPYHVVEPMATVSSDLMNVIYAGYDNPISISVPGVPHTAVRVTVENGAISSKGNGRYIVRAKKGAAQIELTVFAKLDGMDRLMGVYDFKVRKLPEPLPYIIVREGKGWTRSQGGKISRSQLLSAKGVSAAVDDGILDIPFKVLSFEMVFYDNMGNVIPMASDGAELSKRMRETLSQLASGRRFYISNVRAVGPDGLLRNLKSSMEVVIR